MWAAGCGLRAARGARAARGVRATRGLRAARVGRAARGVRAARGANSGDPVGKPSSGGFRRTGPGADRTRPTYLLSWPQTRQDRDVRVWRAGVACGCGVRR
ncbi:hypothetical protein E3T40_05905 [Cryobacterium sp. TMT1-19]|nr:hypothetical protein E3T40_05905 [Cryobacterium sp. TMT1-19]